METVDFENKQKRAFIEALGHMPQEYSAARVAHVPIALVKGWYDSDPDFNLACTEIKEELLDRIEAKAYANALEGSENMIKFVLERQREAFNPQIRIKDDGPVKHRFFNFDGSEMLGDDIEDAEFTEVKNG